MHIICIQNILFKFLGTATLFWLLLTFKHIIDDAYWNVILTCWKSMLIRIKLEKSFWQVDKIWQKVLKKYENFKLTQRL